MTLEADWEFMGHGFLQGAMHRLEEQAGAIRGAVETIRAFTGRAPRCWESPGLTETEETLDLLRANGIEYVADWVIGDLPETVRTPHGDMTTIPYTVEVNDITVHALQNHPAEEFLRRGRNLFDRLHAEAGEIGTMARASTSLHALENTGDAELAFTAVEFLDGTNPPLPVGDSGGD